MPGDDVAVIAPASPYQTDELTESLDVLVGMGLNPVLGENVKNLKAMNVHSAPIKDRAREMMWAFSDPRTKGVFVATGGNGSAGVLPYLNYNLIAKSKKPFLGMSDITALNNGILAKSGLITFNGQSLNVRIDKGERIRNSDAESLKLAIELMMSNDPWLDKPFIINNLLPRTISPGQASGQVIGGNCDTFVHLLGTPYFPKVSNCILFLEDVHKNGAQLSRMLLHLRLAGVLDRVAGVVLGEFSEVPKCTHSDQRPPPAIEDVLHEYFSNGPPCVYGYSFSHGPLTSPIPIGSMCEMDANTGQIEFHFSMSSR